MYEKLIDLNKSESGTNGFRSLASIALTETTVMAADRDARCVYEIDLASSTLMRTLTLDGQPTALALNTQFLVCVDTANSLVYLFDKATLAVAVTSTVMKGGVDQVVITDDNLVFVRSVESGHVILLNGALELKATFSEIQTRVTNFTLIRDQSCLLAIGGMNSKQQFKILGYVV